MKTIVSSPQIICSLILILLSIASTHTAESIQQATHILDNGILRVEVMEPNSPHRYNTGTRFTNLAAVLQVTKDQHTYLFYPAKHSQRNDHAGLAAEFDLCIPGGPKELLPAGYNEAKAGEGFMKIGVGVLRKKTQRYSLFQSNDIITPSITTVEWKKDSAIFAQQCSGTNGYAYELSATIILDTNALHVDWMLKNTGSKDITTRQYSHNFCRFDDYDSGTGYELLFPYRIKPSGLLPEQKQTDCSIVFFKPIPKWVNIQIPYPEPLIYNKENTIELQNKTANMSLEMFVSMQGIYTAIHARPSYISPEQFISMTIPPMQEKSWRRSYTFK